MTELGEIPEEWEVKKVDSLLNIKGGYAFQSSKFITENSSESLQVIRMGNVQMANLDVSRNPVFIKQEDLSEREKEYLLQEGDILVSLTGTVNKRDYGNISFVDVSNKYLLNQRVACFKVLNEEYTPKYFYYLLQTDMFRNQFFELGVGGTGNQTNVSIGDLKNIELVYIPPKEQQKIALILSSIDKQIEITDNLIEKTKELKKGLMQRLLTKGIGHSRFKETEIGRIPEEWEVITIGEICEIGRGRVISKKEIESSPGIYPVYSSQTTNNGCMGYISSYDFEGKYVTWTTDGVNAGTTFYREGKFNCTNVCGTLKLKHNQIIPQFLSLVLNNFTDKYVVRNGNPKLMNNIMAIIKIPISKNLEEQNKITKLIFSVDKQIEHYEAKKEKLQELKKGLMQKLLTGKIRVKV